MLPTKQVMATLSIVWMGRCMCIRFLTIEAAYFTAARLFTKPLSYVQFTSDFTTKSIHTIGKDDDIEVKLYPGSLMPDSADSCITPEELYEHYIFIERTYMVSKYHDQNIK